MGSGERVWPRGMGRRIRQVEQAGKAGRECRQRVQASKSAEKRKGEEDRKGRTRCGKGEGRHGAGEGVVKRMKLSDNSSKFMSQDVNRCFYAI